MHFPLRLLAFFFTLLCSIFAANVQAQGNTIIVGQAIDLSGPNGSIGRDYVAGITTYFDSINVSGGVGGKRIKYLVRDDQGNPALSAQAVGDLLEKDKADYLLGGIGAAVTDAVLSNARFAQSGQTLFAPLVASAKAYSSRVLFWRPSPEQEMQYIFSYFDKLGIKSVGIAYQENAVNQDMYQYVVAELRKRNMLMSGLVRIGAAAADMERESAILAKSNPGIVIAIADTLGTGIFLKEFRKQAPRTFVAGMSLINLDTLAEVAGPKALEWTVFSQVVPNPLSKKSLIQIDHSNMMKKFRDEDLSALTFEGFMVAKTLVKAIQTGKPGRDALQGLLTQKSIIDLGGVTLNPSESTHRMSNYVDMALFRKGGGLLF
ncbi:ABC transporter substrate-binding protein [Undibacterium pigrum]|uniref:Amino acid/amide ABC transporter substrate-binding protein (HAAT family) n=1 Tax=Undibacterium pigrum TaxID=401470 RepID=A0A318JK67_9BURK|nr:ABC transporter substrate-binding protein [Undibacterium pigrum]PXX47829.1 amino acid/amide ABC transporter substrate-binding protein (HAAT family) [Undibacterium pigrum]